MPNSNSVSAAPIKVSEIELANMSPAERFALLPIEEQEAFLDSLTDDEILALQYDWRGWWARPKQLVPPDAMRTIMLAGRGFGKTRSAVEWIIELVQTQEHRWGALIATDLPNLVRIFQKGPSGFPNCLPPWVQVKFVGSPRPEWTFTYDGHSCIVSGYSAEDPDSLLGFSGSFAVLDEFAAYRYLQETYDMLMMALREGANPKILITTTPRPIKLLREIVAEPGVHIVRGSSYENRAISHDNFKRYEGTTLGRQELHGEILPDDGAVFKLSDIDATRVHFHPDDGPIEDQRQRLIDSMDEIVVAVDPSVKKNTRSDACGIAVIGRKKVEGQGGARNHFYVIEDATRKCSPLEWSQLVVSLFHRYRASKVLVEVNQGGDLCKDTLRAVDDALPIEMINAVRNKIARAEPVGAICEQHRIHHIGTFRQLEEELTEYDGASGRPSPNRLDAYVYGVLYLARGETSWAFDPGIWEWLKSRK